MLQRAILNRAQNVLDIQALCFGDDSVTHLDVGSGDGKALRGLTTILTCIEAYAPAVTTLKGIIRPRRVYQMDVFVALKSIAKHGQRFDRVTAFDFIEHLEKDAGNDLITSLEMLYDKELVFFVPIEEDKHRDTMRAMYGQVPHKQLHLQTHKSRWTPQEFTERGYSTYTLTGYHGEGFDAFFACKYKSDALVRRVQDRFHIVFEQLDKVPAGRLSVDRSVLVYDKQPRLELIKAHNGEPYYASLSIGPQVELGSNLHIGCANYIRIDRAALLGSHVTVMDHDHNFDNPDFSIREQGLTTAPVTIGAGAWLGSNVTVTKGVHIGRHSVIGANSVVTKSVPAYSVSVGAPARVVKTLPKPKPEDLLSIIIPVRNGVRYTVQCVESIMAFAPLPYEVVVVDNASTDSTAETLTGYNLVDKLVSMPTNRGFAAACNAGAKAAEGDYLCFLNNDALINEYTMISMLGPLVSMPEIGLIGPMCNAISGSQAISIGDKSPKDVADELSKRLGQVAGVPRVAGVCIMIRRSLFDEVGGFDERYGLGNYEDDDLCHKVQDAGHSVGMSLGGFCYHYGSTTFKAEKIDYAASLATNKKLFEDKFGETYEEWVAREWEKLKKR